MAKTEFWTLTDKANLYNMLKPAGEEATKVVINELQRLESVIRDYEIALESAKYKLEGEMSKKPIEIPTKTPTP